MLQLIDVKKDYKTAGQTVHALKGVNLRFRRNEFVSILGASGCGKTTMLNIIGGLDKYTSGDLIINGKSTKTYKDHDWDVYRNHRIGFVFQSYNLIPQQTVLGNVEIALTIAGLPKAERRRRAEDALIRVGLGAEMKKRPNQLSGGQMQRVAIARALVNNPEILLADEPTGALDTETSVQIMELIKEIAGERLVIMVTHNPELAEQYSSRIVRLQDGLVVADSNPYEGEAEGNEPPKYETNEEIEQEEQAKPNTKEKKKKERSSMSFKTSLGLSAGNLLMKKGRTIITSIAGSIGIISVCLVLALSNGFNNYIVKTQEDMLSSNPLQINETTVDVNAIMSGMSSASDMPDLEKIGDNVYVNSFLTNMAQGMTVKNDLSDEYLEWVGEKMDKDLYEVITYSTGMTLDNSLYTAVSTQNEEGKAVDSVMSLSALKAYYTMKLSQQDEKYASLAYLVDFLGSVYGTMPGTTDASSEEFGKYVLSQYDVIEGEFPKNANEAVLVIGDNNDMTDLTLAQLGFLSETEFLDLFNAEEKENTEGKTIPFDKVIGKKFILNNNDAIYKKEGAESTEKYLYKYEGTRSTFDLGAGTGETITISGVLRVKEDMNYGCLGSGLYVTEQARDNLLAVNEKSQIAATIKLQMEEQRAKLEGIGGLAQTMQQNVSADLGAWLMQEGLNPDLEQNTPENQFKYQAKIEELTAIHSMPIQKYILENKEYLFCAASTLESYYMTSEGGSSMAASIPEGIYVIYGDSALRHVGGLNKVNGIAIYTDTFEAKEGVLAHLDQWNEEHKTEELKGQQVKYTDTVGMIMSMVEMMLNAITYVLVAFTAISLVVSSVMIGIITYVSVVERVKEIGVLRSLGARKKDIKNLFNAETFIIGLSSGVFGVAVTYLLSLGINALLGALTGIATLAALPFSSALIMIAISVVLTLISGLIPANAAAKKDPVVALRTE